MLLLTTFLTTTILLSLTALTIAIPQPFLINPAEGKKNIHASNILVCPKQPAAIDILCGGDGSSDRTGPMDKCYPRGAEHCKPSEVHEGRMMRCPYCRCHKGQFQCGDFVTVPGGELSREYFRDVGCNCDG
ncbi:MAG: hypothetical protein LQ349_008930 [Xanthoria aureola]|nr:MAG: hypothetical protein LQ349_008930 [Xanthoria aureola]